jgi:phosphatidylglycerol lysyltransferase
MKLLVGSPGLDRPCDRRYYAAHTAGRIEAFVTVLPGAPGVWGIDVMCRRPDAASGCMELLLMHVAEALRDEGATQLSLGPCPMAGITQDGAPPLLRATFEGLFGSWWGNKIFGFQNLYRFKKKFRPRWEPVFFAAGPRLGILELYLGCRMWGLY